MTDLQCLSEPQVIELDRLCAEVAQTGHGFGSVTIYIEHGHPRYVETAIKKAAITPTGQGPPCGGAEMK